MPQISSIFVRKMLEQAPPELDRRALLSICGLKEEQLRQTAIQVAAPAYYTMLERVAGAYQGKPDFHIRQTSTMKCEDLGAVGLAFKVAPTLRDSLNRLSRYMRLIVRIQTFELRDTPQLTELYMSRPMPQSIGARLSYEASVCTIVAIMREASGFPIAPVRALLRQAPEGDRLALERHLQCDVEFEADKDALFFSAVDLLRGNRLSDEGISTFFETQLDESLESLSDQLQLAEKVLHWVKNVLSEGPVTIAMAASAFGMSPRTLQRSLSSEGWTFNTLVERARRSLAEQLLEDPNRPLADVAFMTGFSEQSTFSRAFRRWYGVTPGTFRSTAGAHST